MNNDSYTEEYKIVKPELKSNITHKISAQNKIFGKIEDCFNKELLQNYELNSISFDFFVNWEASKRTGNLDTSLWFKRTLVINNHMKKYIDLQKKDIFIKRLIENESLDSMKKNYKFLEKYNLSAKYMIIKDTCEFLEANNTPIVVSSPLVQDYMKSTLETLTLNQLNNILIKNSGGRFKINKPLNYSETQLEYFLAANSEKTGSLWPGDCDMILFDDEFNCKCILEFKKCTKWGNVKVEKQDFTTYYNKDKTKYTRLGILRDYFSNISKKVIPYVVVFYPTNDESIIKIESIGGDHMHLRHLNSKTIDIPKSKDKKSLDEFKSSLLDEILKI